MANFIEVVRQWESDDEEDDEGAAGLDEDDDEDDDEEVEDEDDEDFRIPAPFLNLAALLPEVDCRDPEDEAEALRLEFLRKKEDADTTSDEVGRLIEVEGLDRLGKVLDHDPQHMIEVQALDGSTKRYNPLMYAVYRNRVKTVAFLLERGANVNSRSASGESVLGVAFSDVCPKIAELLVSHGAKLDLGDSKDLNAVDEAFGFKKMRFLECVFSRGAVKLDSLTEKSEDPCFWLRRAVQMSSLTLVKCLLDQGLDVNEPNAALTDDDVTPLARACELGEVAIARELVKRGAKTDLMNPSGKTAIMHACDQEVERPGVGKVIKCLVDCGVNVDARSSDGATALMLASQRGHSRIIRCLLDANAEVDLQNEAGSTALMLACAHARADVVDVLLRAGARTEVRDKGGQTALIIACAAASSKSSDCALMSIVELLVDSGAHLDAQDTQGATALICASESGHIRVVQELLAHGAEVDLRANDGQTALMRCCDYGNTRAFSVLHRAAKEEVDSCLQNTTGGSYNSLVVKTLMQRQEIARGEIAVALLEHGAQASLQDEEGSSSLLLACREAAMEYDNTSLLVLMHNGLPIKHNNLGPDFLRGCHRSDSRRTSIVRELLLRGADPNVRNQHRYTALMHAMYRGKVEVVRLLVGHGAAVDLQDRQGSTALMNAALYTRKRGRSLVRDLMSLLFDEGRASPDLQDKNGATALMLAAQRYNSFAVQCLLERRAATDLQNSDGRTALMFAVQCGCEEACQLLIDHGANLDLQSEDGSTALMVAAALGEIECMKILLAAIAKRDAQRNAMMNQQNKEGMTALMLAVAKGDSPVARALLDAGAVVNTQSQDGTTPLMLATQMNSQRLVKLFLERDTSPLDFQRDDGATALMLACARDAFRVADLLIRWGANVNLRDARGRAALHLLTSFHGMQVIGKRLVDRGAELDFSHIPGARARAALTIACRQGYMEVIKLLSEKYRTRSSTAGDAGARDAAIDRETGSPRTAGSSLTPRKTQELSH